MVIKELDDKIKHATISISYNEARDISNGLYHISKEKPEYKDIYLKTKFIFDMIKHGMIQPETIEDMYEQRNKNSCDTKENKEEK